MAESKEKFRIFVIKNTFEVRCNFQKMCEICTSYKKKELKGQTKVYLKEEKGQIVLYGTKS